MNVGGSKLKLRLFFNFLYTTPFYTSRVDDEFILPVYSLTYVRIERGVYTCKKIYAEGLHFSAFIIIVLVPEKNQFWL